MCLKKVCCNYKIYSLHFNLKQERIQSKCILWGWKWHMDHQTTQTLQNCVQNRLCNLEKLTNACVLFIRQITWDNSFEQNNSKYIWSITHLSFVTGQPQRRWDRKMHINKAARCDTLDCDKQGTYDLVAEHFACLAADIYRLKTWMKDVKSNLCQKKKTDNCSHYWL